MVRCEQQRPNEVNSRTIRDGGKGTQEPPVGDPFPDGASRTEETVMSVRIKSRRDDTCATCGRELPAGSEVWLHRKRVHCYTHEEPGRHYAYPETHKKFDRRLRGGGSR